MNRYELSEEHGDCFIKESADGPLMLYDDHEAEIARLREALERVDLWVSTIPSPSPVAILQVIRTARNPSPPDCPHGYWKAHCAVCRSLNSGAVAL